MALLERVTTLLRANLNDMVSRAEDPEKQFRQLLLDMQAQRTQLRDKLARALADQDLLIRKHEEAKRSAKAWRTKALLAVHQGDDDLARAALERCLTQEQSSESLAQQGLDQRAEVAALRESYLRLQAKLEQTEAEGELLLLERRRARNGSLPNVSATAMDAENRLRSLRASTQQAQAANQAQRLLAREADVESRLLRMERDRQVEAMLAEMKGPRLLEG